MAPPIVCVAGGGTAGLEALLSAQELLGDRVQLRLISPEPEFRYRAMRAERPLVPAPERALPVADLAADVGAMLVRDHVVEVRDADRAVLTRDGDLVGFDYLLLATGARGERVLEQGHVWERGRDPAVLDETLERLASSSAASAGVLIPRGARWPLPAYELALVMGWTAAGVGQVTLITAEEQPLGALGRAATELVTGELRDAGVELITGVEALDDLTAAGDPAAARLRLLTDEPAAADRDALTARPSRRPSTEELEESRILGGASGRPTGPSDHRSIAFERLISLPTVSAPRIGGTACDAAGFVLVDERLKMLGSERVWAAGSCLASGLEHSALAAQQADCAIAQIGAELGVAAPAVQAPELTGILLSGQRDQWLMSNPPGTRQPSTRCLWWPTGRAVGRRLARWIAGQDTATRDAFGDAPPGLPIRVEVVLGGAWSSVPAACADDVEMRKAQQREIEQRQLMAVERRERAGEAELRTLDARLRDLDADMKTVVGQLSRSGYLQRQATRVSGGWSR